MVDVSEVVVDSDFAEAYVVLRSKGDWVPGGWQEELTEIKLFGTVGVVRARELEQLPEGDRVVGMMGFYSTQQLYATHDDAQGKGTSDVIIWRGEQYRIVSVLPYVSRGYWKAFGLRMSGK